MTCSRFIIAAALVVWAAGGATSSGQTLYGIEGGNQRLWELTTMPGGPCAAPNPIRLSCNYRVPICPNVPPPGFIIPPPNDIHGDVAVDSQTNSVFLTDGFVVEEYFGDSACGAPPPCTPINAFFVPASLGMGPINGMGMDEVGVVTGARTLFITDGLLIAGISPSPPGSCLPPAIVLPPCPVMPPLPGILTDVTFDPTSATLWACDTAGFVHNIGFGPGVCPVIVSFPVGLCGLVPPLQGIAFDLGSGGPFSPGVPAMYVTDGFVVARININGVAAAPTFYSPIPCSPTNAPLHGLAYASNGVTYGAPRVNARCGTFGQSSTPGPTFGVEYSAAPAGTLAVLLLNTSVTPAPPAFFCPPVFGVGTTIWVNPAPPAFLIVAGNALPGCVPVPLAIPPGVPVGINVFFQWLFLVGPVALDSTEGCEFTVTFP